MYGYSLNKDQYLSRLRRIEGQVRGLQRMVDEDTYCIDILQQVSAVQGALQKVALGLMNEHVSNCVADAVKGDDADHAREVVDEVTRAIDRMVRAR
ncbi:MAG: metal-sensitive transcriptional regulator [Actinomycetota bacterium]|nr:metal-sensitive transcriptional regulator [Actinomycetota bacterium]